MAQYSELTKLAASQILNAVGLELSEIKRINGGAANSSYVVRAGDDQEYVLTVLDNHNFESARQLAQLVEYLQVNNIPVDGFVASLDGDLVHNGPNGKPVIVHRFIEGTELRNPKPSELHELGSILARIHQIEPPNYLNKGRRLLPVNWREMLDNRAPVNLVRALAEAEQITRSNAWQLLPKGLCHGDLFGDNILLGGASNRITILDWETASIDPLVLDIAITCIAFSYKDPKTINDVASAIVEGYCQFRTLNTIELEFLNQASFYALAMLSYHRFVRHNIRYPNPSRFTYYAELLIAADYVSKYRPIEILACD